MSNVQRSWRDKCITELIERSVPLNYLCYTIISRMSRVFSQPETLVNFRIGLTSVQSARLDHHFFYLNDLMSYLQLFIIDPRMKFEFFIRQRIDYAFDPDRPMLLKSIDLAGGYTRAAHSIRTLLLNSENLGNNPVKIAFDNLLHNNSNLKYQQILQIGKILRDIINENYATDPIHFGKLKKLWEDLIIVINKDIIKIWNPQRWNDDDRIFGIRFYDNRHWLLLVKEILLSSLSGEY